MIFLGLEYASDGPELSNEEIDRQFAELEGSSRHLARPGPASTCWAHNHPPAWRSEVFALGMPPVRTPGHEPKSKVVQANDLS